LAGKLAEILNMDKDDIVKKLSRKSRYERIKRKVDKEV
jgi:hypothetical protein